MNDWDDNEAIKDMKAAVSHFERRMSKTIVKAELFDRMAQALKSARGWLDGAAACLEAGVQNVDRAHACYGMARDIERILLAVEANNET